MYNPINQTALPTAWSAPVVNPGIWPREWLHAGERICACSKYIAHEMIGICFACERAKMKVHFLNEEKSNKK